MVNFFLRHPIIAIVLNTMLLVVGYLSLQHLPLCEYPQVKIPEFTIFTHANGDASYMEEVVSNPIEDKIMNLAGIEKITSESRQGASNVGVVFKVGTNIDTAQMGLREVVAQVGLPKEISQPTIVRRGSKDNSVPFFLILIESSRHTPEELTHYTNCTLRHYFRGIDGVAEVQVLGSPYKIDITLDSKKLYQYGITAQKIADELEKALKHHPLGKLNDLPLRLDQPLNTPDDFKKLMLSGSKNTAINLGALSAINLGKNDKNFRFHVNGKTGVGLEIKDASTANPLEVSNALHQKLEQLKSSLGNDIVYKVIIDQAEFIRSSLSQVRNSLIEAILCVMLVVGLFLGSVRLSLVPLVTIPLSLMGSLAVLMAFGYSINTLTLLGAVLATGLVVDDAIVVLENINRHQQTAKNPFEAALTGTNEIAFAVIAMTLTLASVYLPIVFAKDALGQLFAEFAVSLAASVVISGITAITLTPWMSKIALQSKATHQTPKIIIWLEEVYGHIKAKINPWPNWVFIASLIGCIAGSCYFMHAVPKGIGPKEDRGIMGLFVPSVPGIGMDQREQMAKDLDRFLIKLDHVTERVSFIGDFGCAVCCMLTPPGGRTHSEILYKNLQERVDSQIPYTCYAWSVDTGIPGMDNTGQSDITLAITSAAPLQKHYQLAEEVAQTIRLLKDFEKIHIDKTQKTTGQKCTLHPYLVRKFKLNHSDILTNLEICLSGKNDLNFLKDNQKYIVDLHTPADDQDINRIFTTNADGDRFFLKTFANITQEQIIEPILHRNQERVMRIKMTAQADTNLGKAKQKIEQQLKEILTGQESFKWLDSDELSTENQARMLVLFLTALVFIYAILCIQFESFFDPLLILLTVPFAMFGGLLWVWASGQTLNIFSQIGLITLIGLISKHGILLVEFANSSDEQNGQQEEQRDWKLAFERSVLKRFRPIIMTTAAMVLGCIPLILSSGPGAEIRSSLGGVLIGGLCCGTLGTLFLFPRLAAMLKEFGRAKQTT